MYLSLLIICPFLDALKPYRIYIYILDLMQFFETGLDLIIVNR